MERHQIQFEPEAIAALKREAAARNMSVSAIVRDAVTRYLHTAAKVTPEMIARAKAVAGIGNSGLPDVAVNHDKYLAEDFW